MVLKMITINDRVIIHTTSPACSKVIQGSLTQWSNIKCPHANISMLLENLPWFYLFVVLLCDRCVNVETGE